VREDLWSPVIVTLDCGHEIDWRGPMTPSAMHAQVCMDCPLDYHRGVHPWRLVIRMAGYPSVSLEDVQEGGS
jgi:hypothetical protein